MTAVTFDRGDRVTTVLWTAGRRPIRAAVRATAPQAELVDERGRVQSIRAVGGVYTVDLPAATCTNGAPCIIGGAPRLLVEAGSPAGRRALVAPPAVSRAAQHTGRQAGGSGSADAHAAGAVELSARSDVLYGATGICPAAMIDRCGFCCGGPCEKRHRCARCAQGAGYRDLADPCPDGRCRRGRVQLAVGIHPVAGRGTHVNPDQRLSAAPGIVISPQDGGPGTRIAVTGRGWRPGDTVVIRLDDAGTGETVAADQASAIVDDRGELRGALHPAGS